MGANEIEVGEKEDRGSGRDMRGISLGLFPFSAQYFAFLEQNFLSLHGYPSGIL